LKDAFVDTLNFLLSLYGLRIRRRRAAIRIGPAGLRRTA
jgi:hypothetical protein